MHVRAVCILGGLIKQISVSLYVKLGWFYEVLFLKKGGCTALSW